jgi:hypothetical protein
MNPEEHPWIVLTLIYSFITILVYSWRTCAAEVGFREYIKEFFIAVSWLPCFIWYAGKEMFKKEKK